jgi:hypothetical protein
MDDTGTAVVVMDLARAAVLDEDAGTIGGGRCAASG